MALLQTLNYLKCDELEVVAVAVVVVGFDADEVKAVVAVDAELNFRTVY